jgi:hypothetical protein
VSFIDLVQVVDELKEKIFSAKVCIGDSIIYVWSATEVLTIVAV